MRILLIGLLLCTIAARTRAADVTWHFEDPIGGVMSNRPVTLIPERGPWISGGKTITRDRVPSKTSGAGELTIKNVAGGPYRTELDGPYGVTTNWYEFPFTNATLNAEDYSTSPTNWPAPWYAPSARDVTNIATAVSIATTLTNIPPTVATKAEFQSQLAATNALLSAQISDLALSLDDKTAGLQLGIEASTNDLNAALTSTIEASSNALETAKLDKTGSGYGLTNLPGPLNAKDFGVQSWSGDSTPLLQAMIDQAYANPTGVRDCIIPAGTYLLYSPLRVTNDTLHRGFKISGAGRMATTLKDMSTNGCLVSDGLEYAVIENIRFQGSAGNTGAVVSVIADASAGHIIQGCSFRDLWIESMGAATGFQLNGHGQMDGSDPVSTMGSENLFLNIHVNGATNAAILINGMNSLQNTFVGGNISGCTNYGIHVNGGSVHVYSMGFQNGLANGWDFYTDNGTSDANVLDGCRSESMHFAYNANCAAHIRNCTITPGGLSIWQAGHAYDLGTCVYTTVNTTGMVTNALAFRCIVAGTSGGTEPAWPQVSGKCSVNCGAAETISDGSVTWEIVNDLAILVAKSSTIEGCQLSYGRIGCTGDPQTIIGGQYSRRDWLDPVAWSDRTVILNPTQWASYAKDRGIFGTVDGIYVGTNLYTTGVRASTVTGTNGLFGNLTGTNVNATNVTAATVAATSATIPTLSGNVAVSSGTLTLAQNLWFGPAWSFSTNYGGGTKALNLWCAPMGAVPFCIFTNGFCEFGTNVNPSSPALGYGTLAVDPAGTVQVNGALVVNPPAGSGSSITHYWNNVLRFVFGPGGGNSPNWSVYNAGANNSPMGIGTNGNIALGSANPYSVPNNTGTLVVSNSLGVVLDGVLHIKSNTMPAAATALGAAAFWNSNGVVYLLTSSPTGTAWSSTNRLAP